MIFFNWTIQINKKWLNSPRNLSLYECIVFLRTFLRVYYSTMYWQTKKSYIHIPKYLPTPICFLLSIKLCLIFKTTRFWVCWLNCPMVWQIISDFFRFSPDKQPSTSSGSMCLISGYISTNLKLIRSVWSKPWVEYFRRHFEHFAAWVKHPWPCTWAKLQQNPWAILEKFFGTPLEIHISLCVWHNDIFVRSSPPLVYVEDADCWTQATQNWLQ